MSVVSPVVRPPSTVDVFVSYRRAEASYSAGWLHDYLSSRLGHGRVFLDINAIRAGVDFMHAIRAAIAEARVMLVIIGPHWTTGADGRSRLDDPEDPVRLEVEAALRADLLVVPLLLNGAAMPSREQLPPSMARLAGLNAVSLRHENFRRELDDLLRVLANVLPDTSVSDPRTESLPPPDEAVRSIPAHEARHDDEQRARLLAKLTHVYAEIIRQAVQDDRVVRMPLHWQRTPGRVHRQADALLPRSGRPDELLPSGSTLLDAFDQIASVDGDGLLVVGAPGAGKSTALIELAQALLGRAVVDNRQPIPVYLPLRTWSGRRQPIAKWAVQQLGVLYQIPAFLAERWTRTGELLFLLDGLDEIRQRDTRTRCVTEINRFQRFGRERRVPVVVTAREYEYDSLPGPLELEDALVALPLAPGEVESRLLEEGPRMEGVLTALRADGGLRELMASPLLLSLMTRTYADRATAHVVASADRGEQARRLLTDYVDGRFEQERRTRTGGNRYRPIDTRSWLSWLATTLTEHRQIVFDLGRLDGAWLPHRGVRWAVAVVPGILFGAVFAGMAEMVTGTQAAAQCLLLALFGAGVTVRMLPAFRSSERWSWAFSWREVRKRLPVSFATALAMTLAFGLVDLAFGMRTGTPVSVSVPERALERGVVVTVVLTAISGVVCQPDPARARSPARPEALWAVCIGMGAALAITVARSVTTGTDAAGGLLVPWGVVTATSAWLVATSAPTEQLTWSWRGAVRNPWSTIGLIVAAGSIVAVGYGLFADARQGLAGGGIVAIVVGATVFLANGFSRADIPVHVTPNQATRRSLRSGLIAGMIAVPLVGIPVGCIILLSVPGPMEIEIGFAVAVALAAAIPIAWAIALAYGLGAAVQHWLIRFFLWADGSAPLRYARFLDYAVALKLLYRNGVGGYVFIHALVREYFARREEQ